MKLRFILPGINLVTSAAAVIHENLAGIAGRNPEPSGALLTCYLINAPALIIRRAADFIFGKLIQVVCNSASPDSCYRAERILSLVVFMVALGMLWYLVGRRIDIQWVGRGSVPESREWRGITLDAVAILFAMLCGFIAVLNWGERSYPLNLPMPFIAHITWALLLGILFGGDLVRRRSHDDPGDRSHQDVDSVTFRRQ